MVVKLKLSSLFNFRDERLPAKTGIGGKLKAPRKQPLFQPQHTIAGNAAVVAQLRQFKGPTIKEVQAAHGERLARAVDEINRHIKNNQVFKGVRFGLDEASNRNVAVVRDTRTGEVLREIPGEGVLQIAANLRRASGLFVNVEG